MSFLHDQELADVIEAERYRRRRHRSVRCPAHNQLVGMRDGHLHGRCTGCAAEAARGTSKLARPRTTTAPARSTSPKAAKRTGAEGAPA